MTAEMTPDQLALVDAATDMPAVVTDPRTGTRYYLISRECLRDADEGSMSLFRAELTRRVWAELYAREEAWE